MSGASALSSSDPLDSVAGELPATSHQRISIAQWMCLFLILTIAGFTRFYWLDRDGLSHDEIGSLQVATGFGGSILTEPLGVIFRPEATTHLAGARGWAHLWTGMFTDVHPPLYTLILRAWGTVFGDSALAVRSLSGVCSWLSIPLLFLAARRSFGTAVGLWSCAIICCAEYVLINAREVRMYGLVLLEYVLLILASQRVLRRQADNKSVAWFCLISLLAMYTQYFSAFVIVGILVHFLTVLSVRQVARLGIGLAIVGAFYVVTWGPWFWEQVQRGNASTTYSPWIVDTSPNHLISGAQRILAAPMRFIAEPRTGLEWTAPAAGAVLILVPLFFVKRFSEIRFWWLIGIAPLLAMGAVDFVRGTEQLKQVRYVTSLILTVATFFALMSRPLGRLKAGWLVSMGAVLMGVTALTEIFGSGRWQSVEFPELANKINVESRPEELMVYFSPPDQWFWQSGGLAMAFRHYLSAPHPEVHLNAPASAALLGDLASHERLWFVTTHATTDPSTILPGWRVHRTFFHPFTAKVMELHRVGPMQAELAR